MRWSAIPLSYAIYMFGMERKRNSFIFQYRITEQLNIKENRIMSIGYILIFILDVVSGELSALYLFVSLFAVLGQKIYGKMKYGKPLYD